MRRQQALIKGRQIAGIGLLFEHIDSGTAKMTGLQRVKEGGASLMENGQSGRLDAEGVSSTCSSSLGSGKRWPATAD